MPVPTETPALSDGVIKLRPWALEDARFLQAASADPSIQRYSLLRSRPFTAAEAQEELQDCGTTSWLTFDVAGRPTGSLVITDAVTNEPLGQCGVDGWSQDAAQIGYWVAPTARGRGVATRGVVQLTNWLFDLGASRVFLTVVADNDASMRVAQRAGFVLEGTASERSVGRGQHHDVLVFAIVAEEWKRQR